MTSITSTNNNGALAARFTITSGGVFLAIFALLHLIQPEIDPSWRMISELALGKFGWLMTIAFFALAATCIGAFFTLKAHVTTIGGRIGLGFLLVGVIGFILAGTFTTDPITTPADQISSTGRLHAMGAILADGVPLAAALVGWSLGRKNPSWKQSRRYLLWSGIAVWASFLFFAISMSMLLQQHGNEFGPDVTIGWQNRIMMVAYATWPMVLAWQSLRIRRK